MTFFNRKKLRLVLAAEKVGARSLKLASDYSEELVNDIKEKDQIYYRYFYEPNDPFLYFDRPL